MDNHCFVYICLIISPNDVHLHFNFGSWHNIASTKSYPATIIDVVVRLYLLGLKG